MLFNLRFNPLFVGACSSTPTEDNCRVRWWPAAAPEDAAVVTATQGTYAQSITIAGLTGGVTYVAFLECRGQSLFWRRQF